MNSPGRAIASQRGAEAARGRRSASRCGSAGPRARAGRRRRGARWRRGADCRPKPNFVFGPPVEIDGWVSGLTPGATRSWTRWRRAVGHEALELVDVVVVVDHDVADAGVQRLGQLGLGLRVAVQVDAARGRSRRSARCASSPPEATSQARPSSAGCAGPPCTGTPWRRSGPRSRRSGPRRPRRRRRARVAEVVLDDDVGGRAELARQRDGVAAAELQVPGLGDAAARAARRG